MSKFKVGDRVFVQTVVIDHASDLNGSPRYEVEFSENKASRWFPESDLKQATAPDRVMVAARLLAGMLANPSGPIQSNEQSGWDYVNCSSESLSQVALELADALIAEGAK